MAHGTTSGAAFSKAGNQTPAAMRCIRHRPRALELPALEQMLPRGAARGGSGACSAGARREGRRVSLALGRDPRIFMTVDGSSHRRQVMQCARCHFPPFPGSGDDETDSHQVSNACPLQRSLNVKLCRLNLAMRAHRPVRGLKH